MSGPLELEPPAEGHHRCTKCGKFKAADAFRPAGKSKRPYAVKRPVRHHCVECEANHYASNRMAYRFKSIKYKYGIDQADYERMLAAQGGGCAICGRKPTGMWRGNPNMLMVDHDHATGAVRGLLCSPCNMYLGHRRDDPQGVAVHANAVIRYLVAAGAQPPTESVDELPPQMGLDFGA